MPARQTRRCSRRYRNIHRDFEVAAAVATIDRSDGAPSIDEVDVAIIGGGPGGLAAALALRVVDKDLRIKVYERSQELRPVGAAISLLRNGQRALESIYPGAYAAYLAASEPMFTYRRYGLDGNLVSSTPKPKDGSPLSLAIAWHDFQKLLIGQLPEGIMELGHDLRELSQDPMAVQLRFAGGQRVRAKLVIGCDGTGSATWRALHPDIEPLKYASVAVWRTTLPRPRDWAPPSVVECWEGEPEFSFGAWVVILSE